MTANVGAVEVEVEVAGPGVREPSTRLRRAAATVELLGWMLRPGFYSFGVFLGLAAWQAAAEPVAWTRMLAAAGVAILLRGATNVVNDALDRKADTITAPYQPMAMGAVTPAESAVWVALLVAASLGLGGLAGGVGGLIVALVSAAAALATTVLYSALKRTWWPNFLLFVPASLSLAIPIALLVGLDLSGAHGWLFTGFTVVASLATGAMTTLYDAERDAEAGVQTVATRLGPVATFWLLAVLIGILALAIVALAASNIERSWAGAVTLLGVGLCYGRRLVDVVAVLRAKERGPREARRAALGPLAAIINFEIAALAACYWAWALPIAIASVPVFLLQRKAYLTRVVSGRLTRRALGKG